MNLARVLLYARIARPSKRREREAYYHKDKQFVTKVDQSLGFKFISATNESSSFYWFVAFLLTRIIMNGLC